MIEKKEYKYNELCDLMNETTKTGKSKQLQLKNWRRFFEWENPTKQVYRVTKIYGVPKEKEDKRKNNGGARTGAGAKVKVQEEFDVLFLNYINDEFNKNDYFSNDHGEREYSGRRDIYFNNDGISKYFGIYKNIYEAEKDVNINADVYHKIADKLREKSRSWILNKIDKKDGVTLGYGLIAYPYKRSSRGYHIVNEYLDIYNEAEQKFIEENNLKSIKDVIDKEIWSDMMKYIYNIVLPVIYDELKVCYKRVKKYHRIEFDDKYVFDWTELDFNSFKAAQQSINVKVCDEIYGFFLKRERDAYTEANSFDVAAGSEVPEFDEEKEIT